MKISIAALPFVVAGLVYHGSIANAQNLSADATAGQKVAVQCVACHSTDGSNGTGPSLKSVVGRKAGSYPGFRYSRAMATADFLWDEKRLDAYLTDPQSVVPGNLMPYAGMPDEHQRAELIAFLLTLK
jgi:cytochrome c